MTTDSRPLGLTDHQFVNKRKKNAIEFVLWNESKLDLNFFIVKKTKFIFSGHSTWFVLLLFNF